MNIFDERIQALQAQMRADNIKAYIVPATDPHLSEAYAPRFGAMRFYFCAFGGEDGTLLVTQDNSYIYTDGRYWVEAEMELKGTSCKFGIHEEHFLQISKIWKTWRSFNG